ncbi:MAG: VCBS repeat-containing protein [Candidatus Firestonebacteria bacterium]
MKRKLIFGIIIYLIIFICDFADTFALELFWKTSVRDQFVNSSPVFVDMDLDGKCEVAIAGTQQIYLFNYKGEILAGWPKQTWVTESFQTHSCISAGDIDGDGKKEIIAISKNTPTVNQPPTVKISVWDIKGEYKAGWPQTINGIIEYALTPTVVDINKDGKDEIIISVMLPRARGNLGAVYIFEGLGKELLGWPQTIPPINENSAWISSVAVGDIDKDGILEIVVGTINAQVYAWHLDGRLVNNFPVRGNEEDRFYTAPSLGDVDGDGFLEIAIGGCNNNQASLLYLWKYDGKLVSEWPKNISSNIQSNVVFADLDGDKKNEIVFGTNAGEKLYVLKGDGSNFAGWPQILDSWICNDAVIADLDGDNKLDIIIGSSEQNLYAYNSQGKLLDGFPIPMGKNSATQRSPAIGDIDNDGLLEIAYATNQEIFVWKTKSRNLKPVWQYYRGNIGHTGCILPPLLKGD